MSATHLQFGRNQVPPHRRAGPAPRGFGAPAGRESAAVGCLCHGAGTAESRPGDVGGTGDLRGNVGNHGNDGADLCIDPDETL